MIYDYNLFFFKSNQTNVERGKKESLGKWNGIGAIKAVGDVTANLPLT